MLSKDKMIGFIHKWSWAEMTSNEDGKTSASGTMGAITIFVGLLGFLFTLIMAAFYDGTTEYVYITVMVISIGAGLLGYRKNASKQILSLNRVKGFWNEPPENTKQVKLKTLRERIEERQQNQKQKQKQQENQVDDYLNNPNIDE